MLDVYVRPSVDLLGWHPRLEIFSLTVRRTVDRQIIEITAFKRLTPYSQFKGCAEPGVDLGLCVCITPLYYAGGGPTGNVSAIPRDLRSEQGSSLRGVSDVKKTRTSQLEANIARQQEARKTSPNHEPYSLWALQHKYVQILKRDTWGNTYHYRILSRLLGTQFNRTEIHSIAKTHTPCLYLLVQRFDVGAVFELVNLCSTKMSILFRLDVVNMDVSSTLPIQKTVARGQIVTLITCLQSATHLPWSWKYSPRTADSVLSTAIPSK